MKSINERALSLKLALLQKNNKVIFLMKYMTCVCARIVLQPQTGDNYMHRRVLI